MDTRESPVVCVISLSGLLKRLQMAMIDRHVSHLNATKKALDYMSIWPSSRLV